MIVSIHQPGYFPWLGLLDKINKSDVFIVLDTVQLNDNAFQSRNIFLNHRAEVEYLTIPIQKKEYQKKSIRDLKVVDSRWQKKHHGFLIANYKKHQYFDEIYPMLNDIYTKEYEYLFDILVDSMQICHNIFDIQTDTILASELNNDRNHNKDDLVITLLKEFKNPTYLSGIGAKGYQDEMKFQKEGIELVYQDFKHPAYDQKNTAQFKLGLSSLDIAFNLGLKDSRKLLKGLK